ncbi:MAG: TetR/AcrR family transcriptional regulator [Desulfobacteraceae bacterium]|nr:TetR/AcrR family transcriptional regulator [Desulfobacteraceae bacterium]MBC2754969.1 TetR/AcrR family transcriptional regulator [Desulfobacteraceae bacterium]
MPRPRKSVAEFETIKEQILEEALKLMNRHGFDGFSMRKLGSRLGVSAKTIYNYYQNKDDLYLAILTRGFEQLFDRFNTAFSTHQAPLEKLKAMGRAYLTFGLEHANIYNLMFTWHVPKFKDYIGTPMEPVAQLELETALKVSEIFMQAIKEAAGNDAMSEDTARFHMICAWSQMHGFIAGINNTLLDYMHDNPVTLKEKILDQVFDQFKYQLKNKNTGENVYPIHSIEPTAPKP